MFENGEISSTNKTEVERFGTFYSLGDRGGYQIFFFLPRQRLKGSAHSID